MRIIVGKQVQITGIFLAQTGVCLQLLTGRHTNLLLWLHNKEFYGNTVMYHFVRQKKLSEGKTDPSLYSLSVKM